jgi:hypothetical protein
MDQSLNRVTESIEAKMSTFKNTALSSLFIFLAGSCKTVNPQSSGIKHDAGRFLNSQDASIWGDFTQAEYETYESKGSYSKMLPVDHELTQRLEFWADKIREKMIEVMPEVASVPKPKVRVLKSDNINAFAQAVRVSAVVDIHLASAPSTKLPDGESTVLGNRCPSQCLPFKGDLEAKRGLVQERQRRINAQCQVTSANGSLTLSDDCLSPAGKPYQGPTSFNRYETYQMFNYVSILSEAVKVMSEADMVVTLAHELGHYYLAHPIFLDPSQSVSTYNYLYVQSDRPASGKPKPVDPNDANYALLKEFDATVDFSFPSFEGQKYPTILSLALADSVADGLNRGKIADRCITGTDVQNCLRLGYEVSKPAQAYTTWAFNSKADLFSSASVTTGAALALKFEEAFAKQSSILRSSDLSTLKESLAKYIGESAPKVNLGDTDETIASFLPAYVEQAKVAIEENPKKVARLSQVIFDKGLGFYTAEQEADDVASEILYELGFEPDLIIKNWLNFLDRSSQPPSKKEACKANYASGFKTPVWIGQSTEPHHGDCYRAYNAYREIEIHREFFEKNKIGTRPQAPGKSWEELVAGMKGKSFIAIPSK